MSPQRLTPLEQILVRLDEIRATAPRCIIALDGRGGAGKSSLARSVVAALPGAVHVEFDWFHLPQAQVRGSERYDCSRLASEVLEPFRVGQREFEFKRYNWGYLSGAPDGFADEPIRLGGVEVIVLEGCGVLNPELVPLYDLRVWLDTAPEESLARGVRRDVEEYGLDPERVRLAWNTWTAWEREALAKDDRRLRADLIV